MRIMLVLALLLLISAPAQAQKVCDYSSGAPVLATDYLTVSKNCTGTKRVSAADISTYVWAGSPGTNGQIFFRSGGAVTTGSASTIRDLLGLADVAVTGLYSDLSGLPSFGTMAYEDAINYTSTGGFAAVALSGDYDDLDNRPVLDTMAFESAALYYTSSAIDGLLTGKADVSHGHIISDVTGLQASLDSKIDENSAITGSTKTKITYDAKGLVTSGADATTADINDSSDRRYVTDAQLVILGNTSGTNTGDQTNITGNSATATALEANGANCSAGYYPLGVDESGAAEGCTAVSAGGINDGDYGDIVFSSSGTVAAIATGVIVNADINAAAAIDASKIADGSVSNAEFQYLGGVTSDIQTQFGGKQAEDATLTALAGVTTSADKLIYATGADSFTTTDFPSYGRTLIANTTAADGRTDLGLRANEYCWAASDFNTTAVTAATSLAIEYLPAAFTVTAVRAYTRTAPTGLMTIDINESGTTILSTKLTIDANEKSSGTAVTAAVISDTAIAASAEITVDVDSTTGGKGLVVCMEGTF